MMLLLAAARRGAEYDRIMRQGWRYRIGQGDLLGVRVSGKRVGILGMGRIGQAFARRARGFDMTVLYHGRTRLPPEQEQGAALFREFSRHAAALRFPLDPRAGRRGHRPDHRRPRPVAAAGRRGAGERRPRLADRRGRAVRGADNRENCSPPGWTCSAANRTTICASPHWTMSCCRRMSAAPPARRATRWDSARWTILPPCWPAGPRSIRSGGTDMAKPVLFVTRRLPASIEALAARDFDARLTRPTSRSRICWRGRAARTPSCAAPATCWTRSSSPPCPRR